MDGTSHWRRRPDRSPLDTGCEACACSGRSRAKRQEEAHVRRSARSMELIHRAWVDVKGAREGWLGYQAAGPAGVAKRSEREAVVAVLVLVILPPSPCPSSASSPRPSGWTGWAGRTDSVWEDWGLGALYVCSFRAYLSHVCNASMEACLPAYLERQVLTYSYVEHPIA